MTRFRWAAWLFCPIALAACDVSGDLGGRIGDGNSNPWTLTSESWAFTDDFDYTSEDLASEGWAIWDTDDFVSDCQVDGDVLSVLPNQGSHTVCRLIRDLDVEAAAFELEAVIGIDTTYTAKATVSLFDREEDRGLAFSCGYSLHSSLGGVQECAHIEALDLVSRFAHDCNPWGTGVAFATHRFHYSEGLVTYTIDGDDMFDGAEMRVAEPGETFQADALAIQLSEHEGRAQVDSVRVSVME